MLHLAITKSTTTTPYYSNITKSRRSKKYNITHPLKMLHLAITKSATTTPLFTQTLLKVQHNPPPKDVAFGYYQKYNNNPPIYSNINSPSKEIIP